MIRIMAENLEERKVKDRQREEQQQMEIEGHRGASRAAARGAALAQGCELA